MKLRILLASYRFTLGMPRFFPLCLNPCPGFDVTSTQEEVHYFVKTYIFVFFHNSSSYIWSYTKTQNTLEGGQNKEAKQKR